MVAASDFKPPRDRDAWGTIRGYVYQVDLTIDRWLDLQPSQMLELERGEDIDLVSRALVAQSEEQRRLLEQVKHRDAPVTLRSASALGAIVSAIEHLHANADQTLLFRYTTNAEIGKERASTIPGDLPAITAWEQVRVGTIETLLQRQAVEGILIMLQNATRPEGIHEETWETYRAFIGAAGYDAIVSLMRRFEWSTGGPAAGYINQQIKDKLIARGHATGPQDAEALYQRLFLHVFKLLTQQGVKQLTAASLVLQLSQPTLNEADHALLHRLSSMFQLLDARVSELEQTSVQLRSAISNVSAQVEHLASENRINAVIDYRISTPILDVPPLSTHLSPREETVSLLVDIVNTHVWTAIDGGAGSGKTQLALLIASSKGTGGPWLTLRDLESVQAAMLLDAACSALTDAPMPPVGREVWYRHVCERLGPDSLIVLDDLPRLSGNDELSSRLLLLARACQASGVKLLSTSGHQLPVRLQTSLGEQVLHSLSIPAFTSEEASQILQSYGAPASVLNPQTVGFIKGLTRSHPVLMTAVARYLDQHDWIFTDEALAGLFAGNFTTEINDETMRELLGHVEDAESRELLYRLSLDTGSFTMDEVRALAQVEPTVARPDERIATLAGLWVQHQPDARLSISPLVSAFGSAELHIQTRKGCHRVLGDRIVQKGAINQIDIVMAIPHFLQAEEFDRAGVLLLVALNSLHEMENTIPDAGLLSMWSQLPLPEGMSLGLRIYLRALQIAVRHKRDLPVTYLTDDLNSLLRNVTENEAWALLPVVVLIPSEVFDASPYLLLALRWLPGARLPAEKPGEPGELLKLPQEFPLEGLIWADFRTLSTVDQLRQWVSMVEQLTPQQQEHAFTGRLGEGGSIAVADRLWLVESYKPEVDQQWDGIIEALTELKTRAHRLNVELLWAAAVRALIIVLAEYRHDLPSAIALTEAAIAEASTDPRVQFLIKVTLGKQYLYAGDEEKAATWLDQALGLPTEAYPNERMVALVELSRAIGDRDADLAISYLQQAVGIGRTSEQVPETELVKALGELAIAHWLQGNNDAAFAALNEGGERLFASRGEAETDSWKSLFVIFGHVCGYITSVELIGEAPAATPDGVPYIAPKRGMLFTYSPERASTYDGARDCFLMSQLAMMADATGDYDSAAKWAIRGLDMARAAHQTIAIATLTTRALPSLVMSGRYAEVLDAAVEAAPIHIAVGKAQRDGSGELPFIFEVPEVLGPKPNEWWLQAERTAALIGLLPIVFRLGTLFLNDPAQARRQVEEVAGLCRDISTASTEPSLWTGAAELLDMIFKDRSSFESLVARGNALHADGLPILQVVSYLGATLKESSTPEKAVQAHLAILGYIDENFRSLSIMYERVIIAFLVRYWENAFQKAPFRFRTPRQFGDSLAKAISSPREQRARAILETVASGVGVRIPRQAE